MFVVIGSTRAVRVWAYPSPTDLRKGYDGLYHLVADHLQRDPLSGDCFLFVNRPRNRAKVLLWDGTGLCIYMKRLERGSFRSLVAKQRGQPGEFDSERAGALSRRLPGRWSSRVVAAGRVDLICGKKTNVAL